MTLKLESTTTKLRKGFNLAWYHHFTHITCVQKLRGLRQKLDAQTGPSLSKCEGFRRKLICYKGISFFCTFLNSRIFVHSICTIQRHILKFEPFLTSFAIFHAFNDYFVPKENEYLKEKLKKVEEEKMILELYVADLVGDQKNKMHKMRMKIRKIRKYAVTTEVCYHYVVGAIVTFVAILIVFIVAFKCFR